MVSVPVRTALRRFGAVPRSARGFSGFTMVELLTTLVVLAILLAIAAPSMATFINNSRLRSSQGELVAALMLARSEATKRGTDVTVDAAVRGVTGAEFSGGWRVFLDANRNGQWDAGEEIIRNYPALSGNQRFGAARGASVVEWVVFNSRGFLASPGRIDFSLCGQAGQTKGYKITLDPVGLADVTEKSVCT